MLCSHERRYRSSHLSTSRKGALSRRHGLFWASRLRVIRPARSRTLRCFVIEGAVIKNGSESSLTESSPCERRARMARRVGSESAANVALRWSGTYFTEWLISQWGNYLNSRCACQEGIDLGRRSIVSLLWGVNRERRSKSDRS